MHERSILFQASALLTLSFVVWQKQPLIDRPCPFCFLLWSFGRLDSRMSMWVCLFLCTHNLQVVLVAAGGGEVNAHTQTHK
jgi:hypothetical protein